jgi:murein DD-endopeptidase MepM/ murein hydrolase activator NlpD
MSWREIMNQVLPPINGISPNVTSPFGAVEGRKAPSSIPHGGVDFNYVGGQHGVNLTHPSVHAPVSGVVTSAGQGPTRMIAIRDADGLSHEILHTDSQLVRAGQKVSAGDPIGTMGNRGTHDQHVHYQLKDRSGHKISPSDFWDRRDPAMANTAQPVNEPPNTQTVSNFSNRNIPFSGPAGSIADADKPSLFNPTPIDARARGPFSTGGQFVRGPSSRPLYATGSLVAPAGEISAFRPDRVPLPPGPTAPNFSNGNDNSDADANGSAPSSVIDDRRYLARVIGGKVQSIFDTTAPAASFGERFGNWTSSATGATQPAPLAQPGLPPGLVSGQPMPQWPVRPPIFDFPGRSGSSRDGSDSDNASRSSNSQGTGIPFLDDYIRYLNRTYDN